MELMFDVIKTSGAEMISIVLIVMLIWGYKHLKALLKQCSRLKKELEDLMAEVKRLEIALKESESQKSEEIHLRENTQRQLEAERKEQKRLRSELQRKDELLRDTIAKESELQQQLGIERQEKEQLHSEVKRLEETLSEIQKQEEAKRIEEAKKILEESRLEGELSKTEAEAQYELGMRYYKAKDYKRAIDCFRIVAEQGDAKAQYSLGVMYDDGDKTEAMKWYRKAAQQGYIPAQKVLNSLDEEWD